MKSFFYDFSTACWQLNLTTIPAGPILVMLRGGSIPRPDWFEEQRQIAHQLAAPTHVAYSRSWVQRYAWGAECSLSFLPPTFLQMRMASRSISGVFWRENLRRIELVLPQQSEEDVFLIGFAQRAVDLWGLVPLKPFLVSPNELYRAPRCRRKCASKGRLEHADSTHLTYSSLCVR